MFRCAAPVPIAGTGLLIECEGSGKTAQAVLATRLARNWIMSQFKRNLHAASEKPCYGSPPVTKVTRCPRGSVFLTDRKIGPDLRTSQLAANSAKSG